MSALASPVDIFVYILLIMPCRSVHMSYNGFKFLSTGYDRVMRYAMYLDASALRLIECGMWKLELRSERIAIAKWVIISDFIRTMTILL